MFDKEELSIVSGLFPNTLAIAEAEKLGQQEAAYKRFSGAAGTQNPFAGLAGLTGMFGTAAGQELRGLAGAQSPTMQLVSLRDQAAKQFDTSTPEGLVQMAQFLNQQGDAAGARQAIMVAQGQAQRGATLERTEAEITAKMREPLPAIAKLQAYRTNLVAKFGENDPRVKEVDKVIAAEGEGRGTKIVLPTEQSNKVLREKRTGKFLELEDAAITATDTIQITKDFNNVLGSAFTGVGSGVKLTASQFANALGVNVTGTTESEQLDQLFAALTVGQAKNLKGSLSDKDVKFLKEAVGSRGLTKETLQNVIQRIERNALIDQKTFELAQGYTGDMAQININDFRKQAQKDVNDTFEKRKRLQELRQKAGSQPQ